MIGLSTSWVTGFPCLAGGKVIAGTARLADERKLRSKVGVSGCSRQAPAVVATWSPPSDPTSTPATPPEFVPPEQQPGTPLLWGVCISYFGMMHVEGRWHILMGVTSGLQGCVVRSVLSCGAI